MSTYSLNSQLSSIEYIQTYPTKSHTSWNKKKESILYQNPPQFRMRILRVCLGIAYLVEIENFLLKTLQIKLKGSWNSTVRLMNSTKKV